MELKIVKFFNRLGRGTVIDDVTDFVSRILYLTVFWAMVGMSFLLFDKAHGKNMFVAFAIASMLHFAVTEGFFKRIFAIYVYKRKRPYLARPDDIKAIGREHGSASFPSSHMSTSLLMLSIIYFFYPPVWPALLAFILFMAYARMHNGMHYPSDVIAGTVFGTLYGFAGIYLSNIILDILS